MAKPLMDVAQELMSEEEPTLPSNVSNRLLAGMIISSRDYLKKEINSNSARINANARGIRANSTKYIDLVRSDRKWAAIAATTAIVLPLLVTALITAIGG
jgi:hypothetical protein